ncbi:telomere binding protein [Emydomyces testavorans]|uniref:Telomere binding protein n=1 Tax=Emydomyces testavorans TaxID=2070801 RepID=A0AAF0DHV4_9EURO|nr:telomere binding protein [Emydomyces testavorans]
MDSLLTAVKTVDIGNRREEDGLSEAVSQSTTGSALQEKNATDEPWVIDTPQEALRALSSGPSEVELLQVLNFLDPVHTHKTGYDITDPESFTISILNSLITVVITDRWTAIETEHSSSPKAKRSHTAKSIVLRCFTSVSGIGALIANLRTSLDRLPAQQTGGSLGRQILLRDTVSVLSYVLQTPGLLLKIFQRSAKIASATRKRLAWSQLIAFLASGRVLSIAAEAFESMKDVELPSSIRWIGEGKSYASWLGRCIVSMALSLEDADDEGWKSLAKFTQRSLGLGYLNELSNEVYIGLLLESDFRKKTFGTLVGLLEQQSQKRILESIMQGLEEKYLPDHTGNSSISLQNPETNVAVRGVSAAVALILDLLPSLTSHLIDCLIQGVGGKIRGINMRRALVVMFANRSDILSEILNRAIVLFGDELYIKHAPQMAQEANSQIILLTAGYLHRSSATELVSITKSGPYLSAITHRIGASLPRSRFLGMVVGSSLSKLTDPPDKALSFQSHEMQSQDALWYMSLIEVRDEVGTPSDLAKKDTGVEKSKSTSSQSFQRPAKHRPSPTTDRTRIISIEEISDKSEEEDMYAYDKPDTDASDSEEDPTLLQRSKPSAPIYVRDLISALRDTENPERYNLAIGTAPNLIRRKAAFGTEIVENANDLALHLVSLQDKYDLPQFHERRLESLIALIVALPSQMARWMAHTLFNVDLSLAHRSSILVALGLAAREVAGFRDEDAKAMGLGGSSDQAFPSKRLPEHLESIYGSPKAPIENISKRISQSILEPLALTAADTLTGPNVMKLQPLSSRANEARQKQEHEIRRRQKSVPKDIHETLLKAFLLPLLGEFGVMMYTMRSFGNNNPFLEPHIISLFLQTVTLLLATIGPYAPNLNLSTSEIFSLLTTLHNLPVASDPIVLPAILSLFLTVVDINIVSGSTAEESLVTQLSTSVLELREWVDGVFERASKEDERVRALAAGIMVKLQEVTKRYQGRLLGLDAKFEY